MSSAFAALWDDTRPAWTSVDEGVSTYSYPYRCGEQDISNMCYTQADLITLTKMLDTCYSVEPSIEKNVFSIEDMRASPDLTPASQTSVRIIFLMVRIQMGYRSQPRRRQSMSELTVRMRMATHQLAQCTGKRDP